jgi:hypothetical protein
MMHLKLAFAAILTALITTTPAMARNEGDPGYVPPPAPEAADQTLGMSIMSVSVLAGCTTSFRGSGVVSINNSALGSCDVTFNRSVRDCTNVAAIGAFGTTTGSGEARADYISGAANDNILRVRTTTSAGAAADNSFQLIVFCPK